jgi:hypothetical protein
MFPDGRTADDDYRGLVDFNRGLEEPGLLALEDEIRAHVRENSLAAQAERAGQEAGRQGRAFRDNIGPWAKSLPGRVGNFVVDEGKRLGGTIGGIIDNEIDPMSDEAIQAVFETTGLLALQAPLTGAKGAAGVFGGRLAKTADLDALSRAERMAASGADRRAIWDETGWFKGTDGKWRFEIDDSGARFPGMNGEVALKKRDRIDQSFRHSDLYEAYPDTAAIPLKPEYANPRFSGAHYSGADEQITLNPNILGPGASKPKARSTTLHELQHAVQSREGFATGGSPSDFLDQGNARNTRDALAWKRAVDAKQAEMPGADRIAVENALVQDYQRADLMDMLPNDSARYIANQPWFNEPDFIKKAEQTVRDYGLDRRVDPYKPDEAYRHLAGEVEARNVQTRRDFTPEQRRAQAPWETQDVPDDLQIVRMGGDGPQMSVGVDDYIRRINPDGKRVPEADRPNLGMGDMYGMAPRGAKPVHTMQTEQFGRVRFVEKDGDIYALARNPDLGEEDVIGYAMNRGDGTELHVVQEAQRLGIGEELSYQFRKRSPYAPSGGLTEGGEATARKVYKRLVDEGVIPRD